MATDTRAPGRPRTFDEDAVLDRVTALFWEKGYGDTSVADLVEATGVHKPSLYRTFGSKEEIFATVVRRYLTGQSQLLADRVAEADSGVDGIHEFLAQLRDDMINGPAQQGCMLVATSTELCGSTPSFDGFGRIHREVLRDVIRPLVARAGGTEAVIEGRANVFAVWLLGLNITTRGAATPDEIDAAVDAMRTVVDSWVSE